MRPFKELRKDPNRPESTDPDDYAFVGAADMHPGREWVEVRHDLLARLGVETGSSSRHSTVNVPFYDTEPNGKWTPRCHLCGKHGANIYYFCFFLHKPSKIVVVVGQDCARRYELGTKQEREFQGRRDEYFYQEDERKRLDTAKTFLQGYTEWHQHGGKFFDFLSSLWNTLQERGTLTHKQLDALDRWIYRPDGSLKEQEWSKTPSGQLDGDRHQGEVTRFDNPPTEEQISYINKLVEKLDRRKAIIPPTRIEASDMINDLKAAVIRKFGSMDAAFPSPATTNQLSYINHLMDTRVIPLGQRRKAREKIDAGLTFSQASTCIKWLKEFAESQ